MITNSSVNNVIFKGVASNTSSFVVPIASSTKNILMVWDTIQATTPGSANLMVQTAPISGIFDTTGYRSGNCFFAYTSNAFTNQNLSSGLICSAQLNAASAYVSGFLYMMNLNSSNKVNSSGGGTHSSDGTIYGMSLTGESPTTATTMIKILTSSGSAIASGTIIVYTLI